MQDAAAQVGIDQQNAKSREREGRRQVGGERRLPLTRRGARDHDGAIALEVRAAEENIGADVAVMLDEFVAGVILGQQRHALRFLVERDERDFADEREVDVFLDVDRRVDFVHRGG